MLLDIVAHETAGQAQISALSIFEAQMSRQTHPRSADVRQGTILWLPSYDEIVNNQDSVSDVIWGGACDPAVYNHPILVLSRPAVAPDTIHFLLVSYVLRSVTRELALLTIVDDKLQRSRHPDTL